MEQNRYKALIAAYFLSRDDERAYESLGFATHKATHDAVGACLGVNYNTIKNMRDEFDSIHATPRQGWHQRPIRPSRQRVAEQFSELSFDALLVLVRSIIKHSDSNGTVEIPRSALLEIPDSDPPSRTSRPIASMLRSITGRKAEDAFKEFYLESGQPLAGELIDCREFATGYDFEIRSATTSAFVEVKGLAGSTGSITLTGNEWRTAKLFGERYYIALVFDVGGTGRVVLFQNPGNRLTPVLRVLHVMQEQWSIPAAALV